MRHWGSVVVAAFVVALVSRCGGGGGTNVDCPTVIDVGDACSAEGLRCPTGGGDPRCSVLQSFVCNGGAFVLESNPNVSCTDVGLVCPFPQTECGSCTCDGSSFQCTEGCCVCDAGPPMGCPAAASVVDGQSCSDGRTCASAGTCDAGTAACTCANGAWACSCVASPTVIASNEDGASGIALDATSVYWTAFDSGMVRRAPLGGGAVETVVAAQTYPLGIAVDSTHAYWTNSNNPGDVMTIALDGGAPISLASNLQFPSAISVNAANVFWGTYPGVFQAALDGGSQTPLDSAQGHVYAIAVDQANVYVAASYGVVVVPIGGGAPVTLSPDAASGVAVDAANVYWTTATSVVQMSLATKATTSLVSNALQATSVAVDATSVYWADAVGDAVLAVPIGGGKPVVLAFAQTAPNQIAVGATSVYWTSADATVKSAPK